MKNFIALLMLLAAAALMGCNPTFGLDHTYGKPPLEYEIRVDSDGQEHCHKIAEPGNKYYDMENCN